MKYNITISEKDNFSLISHLIREDRQEDLCFALYSLATGSERNFGIINQLLLPDKGDRNVHYNASFNSQYFDRVIKIARQKNKGIVFIHSHIGPGWQDMSFDDIKAETMLAPRVKAATGLPLIGMTLGTNGDWSGRFWIKESPGKFKREWCDLVKVVGKQLSTTFNPNIFKKINFKDEFDRTISTWGVKQQHKISRLSIGIVGLGSVGCQIAESLLRTGIMNIKLIDFDIVERKNLDRLHGVKKEHIGFLKTEVFKSILDGYKLIPNQNIESTPYSIIEKEGLEAAMDCDILFCCVDRPWPRFVLNVLSYACIIPVIDGGIETDYSPKKDNISQARWRTYTTGPGRRCMKCMEQYKPEDVSLEQSGMLEDRHYINGLPKSHFINRGENVYAFSMALAGMEMQQFLSLILKPKGVYYGPKEMDFVTGNIDFAFKFECDDNCDTKSLIGIGNDAKKFLISDHPIAKKTRDNAKRIQNIIGFKLRSKNYFNRFLCLFKRSIK